MAIKRRWINLTLEKEEQPSNSHYNASPAEAFDMHIDKMSITLQMVELRTPAIIMGLVFLLMTLSLVDHLYRTTWTYFAVALLATAIPVVFFLMGSYKISVSSEKIRIQNSLFMHIELPKDSITKITYANNIMHKYRTLYRGTCCLLILIVALMQIHGKYRAISTYGLENATNIGLASFMILILIFLFYRIYQASHYHTTIKINATDRKITLYPENGQKYQLLKEKLDIL
jgi:hypothetical protein